MVKFITAAIRALRRLGIIGFVRLILLTLSKDGMIGFKIKVTKLDMAPPIQHPSYSDWLDKYERLTSTDQEILHHLSTTLSNKPLISIIMPVYNPPERWLRRAIDSVQAQIYPHWELCIADDASTHPAVHSVLTEYAARDPRIKIVYRTQNGHISTASNSALALATGEFIALLDHDDELAPQALYWVAAEYNQAPECDFFYSDEDKIDEKGRRYDPYFKPDWNPDLLTSQNYTCHLSVYRTRIVRSLGGFRLGVEGAQDWDLALRVAARIPAAHIRHIQSILYHWRSIKGSTATGSDQKDYAADAAKRVLQDHFAAIRIHTQLSRAGDYWHVRYPLPTPAPLVSIIIPTRNGYDILRQCIDSIIQKSTYPHYEILIVDNQSDDPQTLAYLTDLQANERVRVIPYDAPFNYSAINNFAVRQASGTVIALVNNDIEVITPDWLEEMVSHALRPEIGAVGAMLYYPDETIQHAGVVLGIGGVAGHAYIRQPRGFTGQMSRARLTQNLSAVTAACLVVQKSRFEAVGGLDEAHLQVAFNDIDFCLHLLEAGYRNVWTPRAELYHHESVTRGYEDTPAKKARFMRELDYMKRRWAPLLAQDPAYHPALTREHQDFSLAGKKQDHLRDQRFGLFI